jgi:hypothetical protein
VYNVEAGTSNATLLNQSATDASAMGKSVSIRSPEEEASIKLHLRVGVYDCSKKLKAYGKIRLLNKTPVDQNIILPQL